MLTHNEPNDEIEMKLSFEYTVRPLFIGVSLFIGIFLQSIFPRTRAHVVQTLKTISHYYLLFYFAISLFCLPGSTKLNVSFMEMI